MRPYSHKVDINALIVFILCTILLFFVRSQSWAESFKFSIKNPDTEKFVDINAQLESFRTPFAFETDRDQSNVKFDLGDELNTFQLQKYFSEVHVEMVASCAGIRLLIASAPQLIKDHQRLDTLRKFVLVKFERNKPLSRITIPFNVGKSPFGIKISPSCKQAIISSNNENILVNVSPTLKVESNKYSDQVDQRLLDDHRLAWVTANHRLYVGSLDQRENARLLDDAPFIAFNESFEKTFCWLSGSSFWPKELILKCYEPDSNHEIEMRNIDFSTYGDQNFRYRLLSSRYVLISDLASNSVKILDLETLKLVFQGTTPILLVNSHYVWVMVKYGIGDERLDLYDLNQQKFLKESVDLSPMGQLRYLTSSGQDSTILTRNSLGQLTSFDIKLNGEITNVEKFPSAPEPTTVRSIQLKSSDGFVHFGYLVTPKNATELKATIVYVHGGGCHVGVSLSQSFLNPQIHELAKMGYPILMISYRNDYLPGPPENIGGPRSAKDCGADEMKDILNGGETMQKLYPNLPVFLWGHSHGSYLVNVMATQNQRVNLFSGVISQSGIWSHEFGSNFVDTALSHYDRSRNPLAHIEKLKIPFLMFHGQRDYTADFWLHGNVFLKNSGVSLVERNQYLTRYRHTSKPIDAYVIGDEGHHITSNQNHKMFIQIVTNFIKSYLNETSGRQ